jgi:hypothetical protein
MVLKAAGRAYCVGYDPSGIGQRSNTSRYRGGRSFDDDAQQMTE